VLIVNLRDLFLKEQWDATEDLIGEHSVLRYALETPSRVVQCVAYVVDEQWIIHMAAEDSFNSDVARTALDQIRRVDFSLSTVSVVTTDYSPHAQFSCTTFAPPDIQLFNHFSEDVRSKIIFAAPSYDSEFKKGMSVKDFRHQIGRKDGWRVRVYRWDRIEKHAPSWP
jgi:hypothetical protein